MKKILLATSNKGKASEILSALLPLSGTEILSVSDIDSILSVPETGKTYEENALLKAKAYFEKTGIPTIAEDSGMEVSALHGELGHNTRRWGAGEKASDEAWLEHFMNRMKNEKNRKARFVCHAVYLDKNGAKHFDGECLGTITETVEGPVLPGIPLSAVFKPIGHHLVYSAMTEAEKNKLSHRGKAIRKLRGWLMEKPSKIIIFTGGGTTGHVMKNLIVMEALKKALPNAEFHYIGSGQGKEAELVKSDIAVFHSIPTGKLRRYFSLQTIPDFFKFIIGIFKARKLLKTLKPNLVFSSGGYVALPVCVAAWLRRIPIITHETDSVPGLSNRIIGKLAKKVLLGFDTAASYFKHKKVIITGNPVSPKLFTGSKERALEKLGFKSDKPILLVMGGSQGAREINELVWNIMPELVKKWQVVHLMGRNLKNVMNVKRIMGNNDQAPYNLHNPYVPYDPHSYRSFEYLTDDYADVLSAADLVISRAGGNALSEISALQKPAIIIPLLSAASDHQRKNALEMMKKNPNWKILKRPNPEELFQNIQNFSFVDSKEKQKTNIPNDAVSIITSYLLLEVFDVFGDSGSVTG